MLKRAVARAVYRLLFVCLLCAAVPTLTGAQILNEPGATPPPGDGPAAPTGNGETWSIDSVVSFGCNDSDITLQVTFSGLDGIGPYDQQTIVQAAGATYMNQLGNFVNSDLTGNWAIFSDSTGGPTDGVFPMPADTNIDMQFILYDPNDVPIYQCDVVMDACNTGNLISNTCGAPTPTMPVQALLVLTLVLGILAVLALRRFQPSR